MNNNSINFQLASFIKSASCFREYPLEKKSEVAFIGRSNVGKSSLINALCNKTALTKTSKSPGCTKLLNFFGLTDDFNLVDLPGYGFAKVAKTQQLSWKDNILDYFTKRASLSLLVLIMDIRNPLLAADIQMLQWLVKHLKDTNQKTLDLKHRRIELILVLNKADKLSFGAAKQKIISINEKLDELFFNPYYLEPENVITTSCLKKTGVSELRKLIINKLKYTE